MSTFNDGWIGNLIGVVSLLVALVLYWRAKREPALRFGIESIGVIAQGGDRGVLEEVTVHYRGLPVPRLSAATFTIWNHGRGVLDGQRVSRVDPLRLEVPVGSQILEAEIIKESNPACACAVALWPDEDAHRAAVTFDFLNPGDGFVVRLLHTDRPSASSLKGTLKGVPMVCHFGNDHLPAAKLKGLVKFYSLVIVTLVTFFFILALAPQPPDDSLLIRLRTGVPVIYRGTITNSLLVAWILSITAFLFFDVRKWGAPRSLRLDTGR